MTTSNTANKAQKEFDILKKVHEGLPEEQQPLVLEFEKEILALVDKFGNSGQSGGSAPYVASAISNVVKKLCLQETISPLMGDESEWNDITSCCGGTVTFQNNRESSIFRESKNRPYYLDAIVFREEDGSCFTGNGVNLSNGETVGSRQYIKSFPFTPKTFYIDVLSTEWADKSQTVKQKGGGWWSHVVKDESQLNEVFEYYDKFVKGE